MQSKDLSGSSLAVDDRRSCVEYLSAEGYSAAEIAGILSVADRTVLRDRQAIKEKNALERDPALAGQVAGQLIREADASMGRLRRIARDRESPAAARVEAERSAFGIFRDMVRTLQRLGYLPEAAHHVQADLMHSMGMGGSGPPAGVGVRDAEELMQEIERLRIIAGAAEIGDLDHGDPVDGSGELSPENGCLVTGGLMTGGLVQRLEHARRFILTAAVDTVTDAVMEVRSAGENNHSEDHGGNSDEA